MVDLVGGGAYVNYVPAYSAMDLVPLPILAGEQRIVATPAVDDILARASAEIVVAITAVEYVIPLFADHQVSARSAVDDVAAGAARDCRHQQLGAVVTRP